MELLTPISRRTAMRGALAAMTSSVLGACGGGDDSDASPLQAAQGSEHGAGPNTFAARPAALEVSPPPTPPKWVNKLAPGSWGRVPVATTLASIDPGKNPGINPNYPDIAPWDPNGIRQACIVTAWCGAAYDEATDNYWLATAGGHTDYGGNEVYRGTFNSAAPAWAMVRPPSGAVGNAITLNDGRESTGVYADGRPRSQHTYNRNVYVPGVGPVVCGISAVYSTAAGGKRAFVFIDEKSGEAAYASECTLYLRDYLEGAGACYDSRRHAVWLFPKNTSAAIRYDVPANGEAHTGSYTAVGSSVDKLGYVSATYLPDDDCILIGTSSYAEDAGYWMVLDCATGKYYRPAFSGAGPIGKTQGQCQPRWVAALGAVCTWNNIGKVRQITRLLKPANPRTGAWTVGTLPTNPDTSYGPTPKTPNGTFGRFAYSPRMGGFLLFNDTAGSTYFYKI